MYHFFLFHYRFPSCLFLQHRGTCTVSVAGRQIFRSTAKLNGVHREDGVLCFDFGAVAERGV
ncbi:hypothetical protein CDL12_20358 [Handroanthus impetiginosus]|uniref:Uncharacterized protein n=1 Tax=Handroanthus impetiginosus TaxID=429701 RepID=A0A2G9GP65_9LAMI|nr:hypothetical protein CDL12_20358 [Handroanthus impetiginosus]